MDITQKVNQVLGGEISPLDTYIELKSLEKEIADALTQIKDVALLEAQQYNGSDYKGFRIEVREGGGRYNYDHIEQWNNLKEQLKEIERMAQLSYKNQHSGYFMNELTGEIFEPARYTFSSPSIIFKVIK